jgi:hypothetical protein
VYIVQVYVRVKENDVNLFIIASHENAVIKAFMKMGLLDLMYCRILRSHKNSY